MTKVLLDAYETNKLVAKFFPSKLQETQDLLKSLYIGLKPTMSFRVKLNFKMID